MVIFIRSLSICFLSEALLLTCVSIIHSITRQVFLLALYHSNTGYKTSLCNEKYVYVTQTLFCGLFGLKGVIVTSYIEKIFFRIHKKRLHSVSKMILIVKVPLT